MHVRNNSINNNNNNNTSLTHKKTLVAGAKCTFEQRQVTACFDHVPA